jgi:hypothetical protein
MKKQYRIINTGKGVINIAPDNLEIISQTANTNQEPDAVLVTGTFQFTGLNYTGDGFQWIINEQKFSNPKPLTGITTAATDGFYREDLLVGQSDGNYLYVKGAENATLANTDPPTGTIRLASVIFFGAAVQQIPAPSPDYSSLFLKRYKQTYKTVQPTFNLMPNEDDYNVIFENTDPSNIVVFPNGTNGNYIKNGAIYPFKSTGTGTVTVVVQPGVTVNAPNGLILNKNQQCFIIKDDYNEWTLVNPVNKATDTVAGLVKTDTYKADPVVYVKETVDTLLEGKANYFLDIKTITGITYNVILTDILHELVYGGTLPMNVIIPNNTTVAFPIGTIFYTLGTNTGIITASGASGVTLSLKAGLSLSAIQNEVRQYTKIGTNTWSVRGDLNLGAVTQTELSYLQGVTSNIQAQINAKTALSGGTANFLMKWLTATTATVSRIWDTGTFLGIGTVNTPTKDLTFGNQANREICVEESSNTVIGRDLIVRAGRTINYIPNANFKQLYQIFRSWNTIAVNPNNNNVYASCGIDSNSEIYLMSAGTGNFNGLGTALKRWTGIAINTATNDVYACAGFYEGSDIYKQTGGVGAFVALGQPNITRTTIAVNSSNGDVYYAAGNKWSGGGGDIYKQTGGTGSFVALGGISRLWQAMAINSTTNDIYAVSNDIYKQTGGTGSFVALGAGGLYWTGIAVDAVTNDVYACVSGGDIYKQTGGTGSFIALGQIPRSWSAITINYVTRDIYATVQNGDIYKQQNDTFGSPNLDGGTYKAVAGTGKGTGKSRFEIYTGQKTASGTDMQVETLREYIDENGHHIYTSMPIYADNAAALAATPPLPVGCEYRTPTGVKMIVY